ncbi:MAG: hypothetical protein ACRCVN_07180 [Spirochaetia bacterium]
MNLLPQNHPANKKEIQLYGCNFRCLQAMAELTCQEYLGTGDINFLHTKNSRNPQVLGKNCWCGPSLHQIPAAVFEHFGKRYRCIQVGGIDAQNEAWGTLAGDFVVLHWNTKYTTGHFTLADSAGVEIWDPHSLEYGKDLGKKDIRKKLFYRIRSL